MCWQTKLSGEIWDALLDRYPKDNVDSGQLSDHAQACMARAGESLADLLDLHPMFVDEVVDWKKHLYQAAQEIRNRRELDLLLAKGSLHEPNHMALGRGAL